MNLVVIVSPRKGVDAKGILMKSTLEYRRRRALRCIAFDTLAEQLTATA
jgi:hypothetical protein